MFGAGSYGSLIFAGAGQIPRTFWDYCIEVDDFQHLFAVDAQHFTAVETSHYVVVMEKCPA
jgi:hypothetical protein